MMTDTTDIINKALLFIGNPTKDCHFKNMFMGAEGGVKKRKGYRYEPITRLPPFGFKLMGVDWAKGSGMNRGDVISRDGNIIEVQFKTVNN